MPEPPLAPLTLLLLALWGGWTGIDGTSLGQFMFARPLVAVLGAGWILGLPAEALLLGVIVEAAHLWVLPFGAARYPEGGPASVAGMAAYALTDMGSAALLSTVVFVLAWEWVGGESIRRMRVLNAALVRGCTDPGTSARRIVRRHALAILLDTLRSMAVAAAGFLLLRAIFLLAPLPRIPERAAELALGTFTVVMIAAAARLFGGRARLFITGAAAGLLYAWLL